MLRLLWGKFNLFFFAIDDSEYNVVVFLNVSMKKRGITSSCRIIPFSFASLQQKKQRRKPFESSAFSMTSSLMAPNLEYQIDSCAPARRRPQVTLA